MEHARKLFLSFSGLLQEMHDGKITQRDLDNGLFFFFCAPGHVFHPEKSRDDETQAIFKDRLQVGRKTLRQIRAALAKAIEQNRARSWANNLRGVAIALKNGRFPEFLYGLLNDLLQANNYPAIPLSYLDSDKYDRGKIAQAIKQLRIPLGVVGPICEF